MKQSLQTEGEWPHQYTYHANEKSWLLGRSTNTSITHNAYSEASGKAGKADRQTSTEVSEALCERHPCLN